MLDQATRTISKKKGSKMDHDLTLAFAATRDGGTVRLGAFAPTLPAVDPSKIRPLRTPESALPAADLSAVPAPGPDPRA